MNISFSPPDITEAEIDEVVDTLKSGWITTGPKTKLFEKQISSYCGTPKSVCLNSATAAMEMVLRLLGIGEGDEVITSAYTYTASASVINHVGAKIVLVDTAKDSFFIDYEKLEQAITERTKAIIPVDIAGVMCDYDRIYEIVRRKRHLFKAKTALQQAFSRAIILADAAHSFGARFKGLMSGQAADFTCFSFHAVKNLTTAEGGAVTWKKIDAFDDDFIYSQLMLLSLHGQNKDALSKARSGNWEYNICGLYYKCNMTDIAASLGIAQLSRYDKLLKRRREIIQIYEEEFKECPQIMPLKHFGEDFQSNGHLYLVRIKGIDETQRDAIICKMAEKGISCNVHFKPLPLHTAYKELGFRIEDFPNSYNQYKNEITLPLHTLLSDEQAHYVAASLKQIVGDMAKG
jgi:dTDP-4-amino-4,6-dideoxygalactose transaminase